jgi:hypothetical protein
MKNLMDRLVPAIVFAGNTPSAPLNFQPVDGVLLWRDTAEVILFWDGKAQEWVPLNRAGFGLTFGVEMPRIELDTWAIMRDERIRNKPGYQVFRATDLIYAFAQCADHPTVALAQPADEVADAIKHAQYTS